MLAARGYRTKKELKGCVGFPLKYTETSLFGPEYKETGTLFVVGPSAEERKWFAKVEVKDDLIVKVS